MWGGGREEVVIAIHPLSQQMFIEHLMPTKTVLGLETIIGSKTNPNWALKEYAVRWGRQALTKNYAK